MSQDYFYNTPKKYQQRYDSPSSTAFKKHTDPFQTPEKRPQLHEYLNASPKKQQKYSNIYDPQSTNCEENTYHTTAKKKQNHHKYNLKSVSKQLDFSNLESSFSSNNETSSIPDFESKYQIFGNNDDILDNIQIQQQFQIRDSESTIVGQFSLDDIPSDINMDDFQNETYLQSQQTYTNFNNNNQQQRKSKVLKLR